MIKKNVIRFIRDGKRIIQISSLLYPHTHKKEEEKKNLQSNTSFKLKNLLLYYPLFFFFVGISLKSQALFALVFTCRYLDLFMTFISAYNTVMKIIFLVSSYGTCYLIFKKFRPSYDQQVDVFRVEALIIPALVLALLWHHSADVVEVKSRINKNKKNKNKNTKYKTKKNKKKKP